MNKSTKKIKKPSPTDFGTYLRGQLKDKETKRHYDAYDKQLRVAYQILELRKKAGISQEELAEKIGTTQGNVARMESGRQNFTIQMLEKIAGTFHKDLRISIG
jgi:ribosome-binding protein aMBF1 (putative translation factor)